MTSPKNYIENVIDVVEQLFKDNSKGYSLKNKVKNPFPAGYQPKLDILEELGPELPLCFMQLIGILHWGVELRWIDIFFEVSSLSQNQENPRLGHISHLCLSQESHKMGTMCI